jgi:hypothetical protein
MIERPIIFSAPMVRAIIEGRKTMTRRVVSEKLMARANGFMMEDEAGDWCPYGRAGDRLWVRENCRAEELESGQDGVHYIADGAWREIENTIEAAGFWTVLNGYGANPDRSGRVVPSIYMPRWASRITLEVTGVRVERVRDITEEDANLEGVDAPRCPRCGYTKWDAQFHMDHCLCPHDAPASAIPVFQSLWDSINDSRGYSWKSNPFVWCISFKVIRKPQ